MYRFIHFFVLLSRGPRQANKSVFKAHTAELRCSYVGLLEDLLEEAPLQEGAGSDGDESDETGPVLTRPIVSRGAPPVHSSPSPSLAPSSLSPFPHLSPPPPS